VPGRISSGTGGEKGGFVKYGGMVVEGGEALSELESRGAGKQRGTAERAIEQ